MPTVLTLRNTVPTHLDSGTTRKDSQALGVTTPAYMLLSRRVRSVSDRCLDR